MSFRGWRALGVALGLASAGCHAKPTVFRLDDGGYRLGAAHPPQAYASMLQGVLLEGDGNWPLAAAAYEQAVRASDGAAEPSTRVYIAQCKLERGRLDEPALAKRWLRAAQAQGYEPAWAAREQCRAQHGLPALPELRAARLRWGRQPSHTAQLLGEQQLCAQLGVLAAHDEVEPQVLEALGQCLARQKEYGAASVAWAASARRSPEARAEHLARAERWADDGQLEPARRLAAAAMDALVVGGAPLPPLPARAVRLSLDEALRRGDLQAAQRRARRGRVPLGELALQAWQSGEREAAKAWAELELESSPNPSGEACVVRWLGGEPAPRGCAAPGEAAQRALSLGLVRLGAPAP